MDLSSARPRRRISLTPMIDVVFLLLVFFMLASRFGMDMQVPLVTASGGGSAYSGPPRLVQIEADSVLLNGVASADSLLADQLAPLMETPTDTVILRAGEAVPLQRLVDVMGTLNAAGLSNLVVVD
ncbi:biopolymer transport protein ExbD [Aquimixticola soesokkakensis]|uniref:Biopolymer transport protein ExbD n=1 Tax=Aquimixticola soesokkakensis TaxID=1519096 RepID=A0A1Y5T6E9_9RHOB|nr:biopolymer transporter ExbD [Aquimixticola soesokkakensis]SLN56595.1 biopolymer transport protein ExbD [Aquimixticola soesokkakensis]